jgi:hypothetical protein
MSIFQNFTHDCSVTAACENPNAIHIFFTALTGPNIMCTFVYSSGTFAEMQELARDAFIEAFQPDTLLKKQYLGEEKEFGMICNSDGLTVKTHGFGDHYQCYFTRRMEFIRPEIVCRILTTDDWEELSTLEKITRWAFELETHIKYIIIKNKVQLSSLYSDSESESLESNSDIDSLDGNP